MSYPFRHSTCNEVFEKWNFSDTCKAIRKAGYTGIEIAPFTLNEFPAAITAAERADYRRVMDSEGLEFVGLHWLMVSPKGLHVTTPDVAARARGWEHIRHLIDLCADLAADKVKNPVMVFGSPKQRGSMGGISREEATRNYVDGLAGVAAHAAERGVVILVEALPSSDCDIINTIEEAAAIVREINSPGVATMFDTHNAADETKEHAEVVAEFYPLIRHLHVNERDGKHPGTGDYPFLPVLQTLADRGFTGWVSLEAFDFSAGAETIVTDSLRYMESICKKVSTAN